MIPKIESVKPLKHYILHVIFEYGEEIKLCPPQKRASIREELAAQELYMKSRIRSLKSS